MKGILLWHRRHRLLTVMLSALYFVSVVLPHEEVSRVADRARIALGIGTYHLVITIIVIAVLTLVSTRMFRVMLTDTERRARIIFFWCLTVVLAAAAYNSLMVSNIEAIHFPQYAFLALPVFSLTAAFGETVLIVTMLGAIDEAYQYFVLKNWTYFDFNDIILNLIGAAMGAVVLYTFLGGVCTKRRSNLCRALTSPIYVVMAFLLCSATALAAEGFIALAPAGQTSRSLLLLSKGPPATKFWISLAWGKTYHVLTPGQGLLVAIGLIICYTFLDIGAGTPDGFRGQVANSGCDE
jgi:glycopeptide antibiotics resistance protein